MLGHGPLDGVVKQSPGAADRTLEAIGLRAGEPIRFRRQTGSRWLVGKVVRVEPDGSITLSDPDGASRSIRPELVEVRRPGLRGRLVWRTVSDVALTWEQLELF